MDQAKAPHILVIDDDPLFRAGVKRLAQKRGFPVTVCSSLREVDIMSKSDLFDVAIVDYYLDDLRSHLRGTDVAAALDQTPVILVSITDHGVESSSHFPDSVRRFVNKRVGIDAILDTAVGEASHGGIA